MQERMIAATGQVNMDNAIRKFDNVDVVAIATSKDELVELIATERPSILFIGEGLYGKEPTIQVILNIKKLFPKLRIIYLAGNVDLTNEARVAGISLLVMSGIYDILYGKKFSAQMFRDAIDFPKAEKDVAIFVKKAKKASEKAAKDNYVEFDGGMDEKETAEADSHILRNVHVISSIKPGTGKSFMSVNIATAIAQYGENTANGKRPKVALIEADLQNLSIGTLLQVEDDKKNVKTVMEKITSIMSKDGVIIGDDSQQRDVQDFIVDSFVPFYRVKNLEALVGSQLTIQEVGSSGITKYHYPYLLHVIAAHYDVIIIDTNSALTHVTTQGLLHIAKNCYYILNLDFNNIRNNTRYKETLNDMGVLSKVKYILNEDIRPNSNGGMNEDEEPLRFTSELLQDSGFELVGKVPVIPKTVFLNRLFEGLPIVLDDRKGSQEAKFELLKIANQIYPIKRFKEMEKDIVQINKKKKGLFK